MCFYGHCLLIKKCILYAFYAIARFLAEIDNIFLHFISFPIYDFTANYIKYVQNVAVFTLLKLYSLSDIILLSHPLKTEKVCLADLY